MLRVRFLPSRSSASAVAMPSCTAPIAAPLRGPPPATCETAGGALPQLAAGGKKRAMALAYRSSASSPAGSSAQMRSMSTVP